MRSVGSNLVYGVHLGKSEVRRELPGFSVSIIQPTFHAEDVPLHTHDTASLIFVLEGTYLTSADGPKKLSSSPFLIFNPAGTTHRDSFDVPNGRFMAMSLSATVTRIANKDGDLPVTAISFSHGEPVVAARGVTSQCLAGDAHDSTVLEESCWELLAAISGTRFWAGSGETGLPSWLSNARTMLNDPGTGALPITNIAEELDIHPVYLARSFRKYLSCSPSEYRMRCRLQRAMDLLCRSDQPLSSIALDAGFFDQSHFTTAFRQQFGRAPGAYRRKLGNSGARFDICKKHCGTEREAQRGDLPKDELSTF